MSSIWNNFLKKTKDKELLSEKRDTKSLTSTNSAAVNVITHKSEYKSYSERLSHKTEITVSTNGAIVQKQGLALVEKSKSSTTSKSNKKEIINGSVSASNNFKMDAIPFNVTNEFPYRSTNMQIRNACVLPPPGSATSKVSYQSPYRNSSGVSTFGDRNYSFVSSRAPILTNKTPTIITTPKASITSSKPTTSSWNNPPKSTSSVVNQKPLARSVAKPMRKQSPGVVYIFHNDKFDGPNEFRNGSAADVSLLKKTFQTFKTPITTYENLTIKEVNNAIQKIEKKDFGNCSCIVIVILTHGTRYGNVYAKDGSYSINDDVLFPILRNKSLISKPKLFFIQACKGNMEPDHLHKDAVPASGSPQEILKCYSTFEGYVAYRTDKGTFFIQALCELLQEVGKTTNIKDIMDRVIKRVQETTRSKQIPSYETTLTKPYIFGDYI